MEFLNFWNVLGGHTHIVLFWGHWYQCFGISDDVSSGFQSQSGFCLIRFCRGESNVHFLRSTSGATPSDLLTASFAVCTSRLGRCKLSYTLHPPGGPLVTLHYDSFSISEKARICHKSLTFCLFTILIQRVKDNYVAIRILLRRYKKPGLNPKTSPVHREPPAGPDEPRAPDGQTRLHPQAVGVPGPLQLARRIQDSKTTMAQLTKSEC